MFEDGCMIPSILLCHVAVARDIPCNSLVFLKLFYWC